MLVDLPARSAPKAQHLPAFHRKTDIVYGAEIAEILVRFNTSIMVYEIGDAPNFCKLKRTDPAWSEQGGEFCSRRVASEGMVKMADDWAEEGRKI